MTLLSRGKRLAEAAIGFLGILFLAPLISATALAIALTAGRPVLTADPDARSRRTGRPLLAFRTETRGFPRLGNFLRESRFDKLPRLVDLLDGECDIADLMA